MFNQNVQEGIAFIDWITRQLIIGEERKVAGICQPNRIWVLGNISKQSEWSEKIEKRLCKS